MVDQASAVELRAEIFDIILVCIVSGLVYVWMHDRVRRKRLTRRRSLRP